MRTLSYPLVLLLSGITEALPATDPATFWSGYQSCAINNCLVPITSSYPCELNDNSCVCTTSGFVSQAAVCLGQQCNLIVGSTYDTYSTGCASSGYTLALNRTQFLSASGTLTMWLEANFWNIYPECANNDCLAPLTTASGCDIDNNGCVCTNGTLMTLMAGCVGKTCSSTDVGNVYSIYQTACSSNGGYSIALTSAQWDAAAGSVLGSSSAVGSGSTSIQTPSKTSTAASGLSRPPQTSAGSSAISSPTSGSAGSSQSTASTSSGFTEDQKIALGVGLGMGLPTITIGAVAIYYQRRERR